MIHMPRENEYNVNIILYVDSCVTHGILFSENSEAFKELSYVLCVANLSLSITNKFYVF